MLHVGVTGGRAGHPADRREGECRGQEAGVPELERTSMWVGSGGWLSVGGESLATNRSSDSGQTAFLMAGGSKGPQGLSQETGLPPVLPRQGPHNLQ